MRESRTYGSVRGALSNERPYRDRVYFAAVHGSGFGALGCRGIRNHGEIWRVSGRGAEGHSIAVNDPGCVKTLCVK